MAISHDDRDRRLKTWLSQLDQRGRLVVLLRVLEIVRIQPVRDDLTEYRRLKKRESRQRKRLAGDPDWSK